jgi:hypothetical protein
LIGSQRSRDRRAIGSSLIIPALTEGVEIGKAILVAIDRFAIEMK